MVASPLNSGDASLFPAAFAADINRFEYGYDFRNQLVSVVSYTSTTPDFETTNTHDPFARRVLETFTALPQSSSSVSQTKQFVQGCAGLWETLEIIGLDDADDPHDSETLHSTHVYGMGIDDEVAFTVEDVASPEDFFSHRDDQNTLLSVTDALGEVVQRLQYGDYGEPRVLDESGASISDDPLSPHLYTGRPMIAGAGTSVLFDYRHRVMKNRLGRFMQRDPLFYLDSLNIYDYVTSSPYVYTDPLGLERYIVYFEGLGAGKFSENFMQISLHSVFNNAGTVLSGDVGYREDEIDKAKNNIVSTLVEGDTLVIAGYSMGGDAASKSANRLADDGYNIELGITIDPVPQAFRSPWDLVAHEQPLTPSQVNDSRDPCDDEDEDEGGASDWVNYYQNDWSWHPAKNIDGHDVENARNYPQNNVPGGHLGIVDHVKDKVKNELDKLP